MRRLGRTTRGKTAPQRLRRTDTFVALDGVLRRAPRCYVDVGYGADATTVLETATRLRGAAPDLRVIGVEIDRDRVDGAEVHAIAGRIEFVHGGFEAVARLAPVGVIRAMNVLRQYDESEHAPAIAALGRAIAPGGVLVEGTSSPSGRLLTANVYRAGTDGLQLDGLLLAPNPRRQWEPRELQTVLPKNWIHRCAPGSPLDAFFEQFDRAVRTARAAGLDSAALTRWVVGALSAEGVGFDRRPALLRRSLMIVRQIPAM